MSTPEPNPSPPRSSVPILGYLGIAAVMFGAGMLIESQIAAKTAAETKQAYEQEMKDLADRAGQAARKAQDEKQSLTDALAKEREDHDKAIKAKDRNLASVAGNAAGVRNALQTELSAARTSGDACLARITRISQAVDGVFDSVGEVTGLAKDLGRENEQLKADNKELADKLVGWQKWNSEREQRIVITGKRGA